MKNRVWLISLTVLLFLVGSIIAGCAKPTPPAPAPPPAPPVAPPKPEVFKWRMQTFMPAGHPFEIHIQRYFVDLVKKLSGERLIITSHGAGEVVGALEIGSAVEKGVLEMGTWWAAYDMGKHPAGGILGGVPFGWTQTNFYGWYYGFGGKELMQEFYDRFNIQVVGVLFDPAAAEMWWRKPVPTLAERKGLTVRAAGVHAHILERAGLGVGIKMLPGGEIYTALETGVVDGAEFASPTLDVAFGFHKVAPFHQTPGWQEPVKPTLLIANKDAWKKLPDDLKLIVETAAKDTALNYQVNVVLVGSAKAYAEALKVSKPLRLSDAELAKLYDVTQKYLDEMAAKDPLYAKIVKSIRDYEALMVPLEALWDFRFKRP